MVGNDPNQWTDAPASYHGGACGFGFADGHAEVRKWIEKSTIIPVLKTGRNGFSAPNSRDIAWTIQRSSAKSR